MKTPTKRNRKRIPKLDPLQLEAALAKLAASNLSPQGKREFAAMLKAAANDASETPEVVMKTMPADRRENMQQVAQAVTGVVNGASDRGKAALLGMSDSEWDELVREAANAD